MAFFIFGQTCASGFRRQSSNVHIPKLLSKNLCQDSRFIGALPKAVVTNGTPAIMKSAWSSHMRVLVGSGCPSDLFIASTVGSKHLHTSGLLTDKVKITFKTEKETVTLSGAVGDSLLDIVNNNSYEIDGFGACDGTVACSTCHCVLDQATYNVLNKGVTEEEQDLLDMASGRQDTYGLSLSGCGFLAPYTLGAVTCLREMNYWLPRAAPPLAGTRPSGTYHTSKERTSLQSSSENKQNNSVSAFSRDIQKDTVASDRTLLQPIQQQRTFKDEACEGTTSQHSGGFSSASSTQAKAIGTHYILNSCSERQRTLQSSGHELEPPPGGGGSGSSPTVVAGASAGALLGAALLAESPSLEDLWHTFLCAAKDSAHFALGPFSRKFVMERYIREAMEALPADAHERLSGRFFVSVTDAKSMKNIIVSEWDSRDDLIECLLCSCYIPMFSGGSVPLFRGRPCIDGSFSNNQPKPFKPCLCISPFAGRAHICPRQTDSRSLYIRSSNADLLLSRENFVRFYRAVVPYTMKDLYQLYWQGFKDAEQFLLHQKHSPNNNYRC